MPEIPDAGLDLLVIGGGPAGLSAARTAARLGLRTLLLEKLPRPGELAHPCGGVIAPVPGFVSGQRTSEGLCFPELDLMIPAALVMGHLSVSRYVSPGGRTFAATFPQRDDFPIAAVDKSALLRLLAGEAAAAGAELRWGTTVTGLLKADGRIVGVRTRQEEIHARVVLSAEGVTRRFTEEAGLYDDTAPTRRYAFIVSEEVEAPAVQAHHVGQLSTLGKRYTSAPTPTFGAVVIPAPGRAGIYFSLFADTPRLDTDQSLWYYLEEYRQKDPRVSELFQGARVIRRASVRMTIRQAPRRVVADGFVGVGDSITPGGHVGMIPAIFLGQQAAHCAARAIRTGDLSARGLSEYDRLFHGPFLRGLDTESKIIIGMAEMSDEELDRLSQTLSKINLAPFFFGRWQPMIVETLKWLVTSLPLILRDWRLIQRMMRGQVG